MNKIDFVVTWVDGEDPEWLAERAQYMPRRIDFGNSVNRYRDWGLMKYWFRGVERYASWVNKIYFVTCGHYPEWLNKDHPKLVCVKHSDYIPQECLPTFNSNIIELYMHHIAGISEQFVLFNDDMFLIDYVNEKDFFQEGLPCETAILGQTFGTSKNNVFGHTLYNNISLINEHFKKHEVMMKYWYKFFSIKYGAKALAHNLLLMPFGHFSGFRDRHLPTSHLKSTFREIWEKESELLSECGLHRFRCREDVTHWLMKNWRFCKGEFIPRSIKWGCPFRVGDQAATEAIRNKKYKAVCINDDDPDLDFEYWQRELIDAFETILPEKSAFEK